MLGDCGDGPEDEEGLGESAGEAVGVDDEEAVGAGGGEEGGDESAQALGASALGVTMGPLISTLHFLISPNTSSGRD